MEGIITLGIGGSPSDLTHFVTSGLNVGASVVLETTKGNLTFVTYGDRLSKITFQDRRSSRPTIEASNE